MSAKPSSDDHPSKTQTSPGRKPARKRGYHHGNLAESLLDAVDDIATRFGLEAVTLRACAKLVGVSPSSAFRHYVDKRALLTAFATRALRELSVAMRTAAEAAVDNGTDPFQAVGLAYIAYALDKPAFFRAMWREESIYSQDEDYVAAANALIQHLHGGFADSLTDCDPDSLSDEELLAWSAVHGLAKLLIDGPVELGQSRDERLNRAASMISVLRPAVDVSP